MEGRIVRGHQQILVQLAGAQKDGGRKAVEHREQRRGAQGGGRAHQDVEHDDDAERGQCHRQPGGDLAHLERTAIGQGQAVVGQLYFDPGNGTGRKTDRALYALLVSGTG